MDDAGSRVVLGTAQLGLDYGIANRAGRPDPARAEVLLARAWREGVRMLDTARAYGAAEAVIGAFLRAHPECPFRVVTKLSPGDDADPESAIADSAARLGDPVAAMLLHDSAMLDQWAGSLGRALRRAVADGRIQATGVSVYTPEEFARALEADGLDIIQAPFNALDRALLEKGLLDHAQRRGKTVHLRSVFLQGLLTMDAPPAFAAADVARWRALCARHGRAPQDAALQFAAQATDAALVIGVDGEDQLCADMDALRGAALPPEFMDAVRALPVPEERVIRPYLWN